MPCRRSIVTSRLDATTRFSCDITPYLSYLELVQRGDCVQSYVKWDRGKSYGSTAFAGIWRVWNSQSGLDGNSAISIEEFQILAWVGRTWEPHGTEKSHFGLPDKSWSTNREKLFEGGMKWRHWRTRLEGLARCAHPNLPKLSLQPAPTTWGLSEKYIVYHISYITYPHSVQCPESSRRLEKGTSHGERDWEKVHSKW